MGSEVSIEIARAALVRVLKEDRLARSDPDWRVDFLSGYVAAIEAMEKGDPSLLNVSPSQSPGYRRGFGEALLDYGIGEE